MNIYEEYSSTCPSTWKKFHISHKSALFTSLCMLMLYLLDLVDSNIVIVFFIDENDYFHHHCSIEDLKTFSSRRRTVFMSWAKFYVQLMGKSAS